MKLFKHKKNDRKESIKTKAEQATVVLLTKIFQKFGVNNACERLLRGLIYTVKLCLELRFHSFLSSQFYH